MASVKRHFVLGVGWCGVLPAVCVVCVVLTAAGVWFVARTLRSAAVR